MQSATPTDIQYIDSSFNPLQYALKRKIGNCGQGEKKVHWMDWAADRYDVSITSNY